MSILPRAAHPRSRGENASGCRVPPRTGGSSPLTRGKRHPSSRARRTRGLIPAHAGKTPRPGCLPRRRPAHPRSRGENGLIFDMVLSGKGSSPLTRGKHQKHPHRCLQTRLIPAHAGKTLHHLRDLHNMTAHPRSRGENVKGATAMANKNGSSPLTRGKLDPPTQPSGQGRLIPAHAGKT